MKLQRLIKSLKIQDNLPIVSKLNALINTYKKTLAKLRNLKN